MSSTGSDSASAPTRRLAHKAVEEAIRALGSLKLSPKGDSMLRALLVFKAVRKDKAANYETTQADVEKAVERFFRVLAGPKDFPGTIRLRARTRGGGPDWMTNDSARGSWTDYAGPSGAGRFLFEDENWKKPLKADAVAQVAASKGKSDAWPPRDVLAAIALREKELDPTLDWAGIIDVAAQEFGMSSADLAAVTSDPVLTAVDPFDGAPWDPANLPHSLLKSSAATVKQSRDTLENLPEHLKEDVERVIDALRRYGPTAIVALAGVPGTSKTFVAKIAARAYASPGCLREIQFSPGYTYEEFIEGPRMEGGKLVPYDGILRDFNDEALKHSDQQYVLLIEEFSRADIPKVLGEFLTYVEYRGPEDTFTTLYRRHETTRIAPNLAVLATYNPTDRSAVTIDAAIIRRLRVLSFPPNNDLLKEMLTQNGVDNLVIDELIAMFNACRDADPERFEEEMPFGHAVFHGVQDEEDLHDLWWQELRPILVRPRTPEHPLYPTILDHYPWAAKSEFRLATAGGGESDNQDDASATDAEADAGEGATAESTAAS